MSKRHKRPRPTTEAQRAAARANGAKSNGPVTDEGKAKAAMNALRHGLSAVSTVVLNNEDREKFAALLDSYIDEYQPATQTERDLVQYMTASKWLLERCWTLEAATLDFSLEKMRAEVDSQMKTDQAGTLRACVHAQHRRVLRPRATRIATPPAIRANGTKPSINSAPFRQNAGPVPQKNRNYRTNPAIALKTNQAKPHQPARTRSVTNATPQFRKTNPRTP